MFSHSSDPNRNLSSLSSLFASSNIFIAFLADSTPPSISSLLPMTVVSSANRERLHLTSTASLLYFFLPSLGMLLPGSHLHLTPTEFCWFSFFSYLFLSASRITAWWKMLNNTFEVGHPSLSPLSGTHSSLSSSLPLTPYSVVS